MQSLFTELAQHRDRNVPVVGAGLSVAAGVPGATDLARHLQRAGGPTPADTNGLFVVADELAAVHGSEWVNEQIAAAIQAAPPRPTRTLRALVRLPSRIVARSNYDDGISVAAQAVGSALACPPRTRLLQSRPSVSGSSSNWATAAAMAGVSSPPRMGRAGRERASDLIPLPIVRNTAVGSAGETPHRPVGLTALPKSSGPTGTPGCPRVAEPSSRAGVPPRHRTAEIQEIGLLDVNLLVAWPGCDGCSESLRCTCGPPRRDAGIS